jgi:hypothetical protein
VASNALHEDLTLSTTDDDPSAFGDLKTYQFPPDETESIRQIASVFDMRNSMSPGALGENGNDQTE